MGAAHAGEPVRVLTVGNSFTQNAVKYLPELAAAGGRKIRIFEANLGGHSLENHVGYLNAHEADATDPKGRPYQAGPGKGETISLREALHLERWDYVTIQQVSHLSFKPETYEPSAKILIAYIRAHAPQAKILVHQTWAYREDHPLFKNGFTQEEMYRRLTDVYRDLATRYDLEIMPVGAVFQAVRTDAAWKFTYPDPDFNYTAPASGALPRQAGLNRGWNWRKKPLTGEPYLSLDAIHANAAGCYLAAAVWFEVLFEDDVTGASFVPAELGAANAAFLRRAAHAAVAAERARVAGSAVDQKP